MARSMVPAQQRVYRQSPTLLGTRCLPVYLPRSVWLSRKPVTVPGALSPAHPDARTAQPSCAGLQQQYEALEAVPLAVPTTTLIGSLSALGVLQLPALWTTVLLSWMPLYLHGIGPAMDAIMGEKPTFSQPAAKRTLKLSFWPLAYAVLHMSAMAAACLAGGAAWAQQDWTQLALLGLSAGMSIVVSNASSHELLHSKRPLDRFVSQLQLCVTLHWPYFRSHPHHHSHVGTPEDHSTALVGQSLYSYIPRYLIGNYQVAWQEEVQEAARRKRPLWSTNNHMMWAMATQVCMLALTWFLAGPGGLAVHLSGVMIGLTYLSGIDYLLHYGLARSKMADGSFSPMSYHTSFNSAYLIENSMFFKVLTHSDHHLAAAKPYQSLGYSQADIQASHSSHKPQGADVVPRFLPGLPMMLASLAVFVPPLWFWVANPVAEAANKEHEALTAALAAAGDATVAKGKVLA